MKLFFIWAKIAFCKVKLCCICDYHCLLYNNLLSIASSIRDTFLACKVYGWDMRIGSNLETVKVSCGVASEINIPFLILHLVN
jgi:hypothetical protein